MLISCKCLNFIATSSNQLKQTQQQLQLSPAAISDAEGNNATISAVFSLSDVLRQTFLQKYPRNFLFYSQCMDFFKQATGPVHDLSINMLSQKDLIYSLTMEISEPESSSGTRSSWQLSICRNCCVVLCAQHVTINSPQFLINCDLLTNNEELSQKRLGKSFSDTFGLVIMENSKSEVISKNQIQNSSNNLTVGSLSKSSVISTATGQYLDSRQLRLRQLQSNLHQRIQKEIAETDERIQRYTTQQYALLQGFREKCEEEYQILASLIQCVPEKQANELLERQPPALDISSNSCILSYNGTRRRNTISSRCEFNNTTTTPTAIQPPNNIFNSNSMIAMSSSPISVITKTANNVRNSTPLPPGEGPTTSVVLNRKISNFDTPPATPEAIPMSVSNSPIFHQQQPDATITNQEHQTFQQKFQKSTIEAADDCLFELEGVGSNDVATQQQQQSPTNNLQNPHSQHHFHSQGILHQILPFCNSYQSGLNYTNAQSENNMNDSDDNDGAEEAEDALDLDTSIPVATTHKSRNVKNAASSLPIEIPNSPISAGRSYMTTFGTEKDELVVDIAASIKALAKSVHGETMFGDLPRPRLRSQI